MMGQIVVLISVGAFGVVMGMLLTALCVASGNAELGAEYLVAIKELDAEYQQRINALNLHYRVRIEYLEVLLEAKTDRLDRWLGVVDAAPPDEDDGCEPAARLVSVDGVWV